MSPGPQTWVLDRFADVQTALHEPRLVVPGTDKVASRVHRGVGRAVGDALPLADVAAARSALLTNARVLLDALPEGGEVSDVCAAVTEPWCRDVTAQLMTLDDASVTQCWPLARVVFEAAAHSPNGDTTAEARAAIVALAVAFGNGASPASVQMFVALTQSLPAILSNAVLALLVEPTQLAYLSMACHTVDGSAALTAATYELLRFATPTRAVYRRALAPVHIGTCAIESGDLVVLRLAEANRDAEMFPEPHRLDLTRGVPGHLSFGAGPHRCSGAAVVRLLMECFLEALATTGTALTLAPEAPTEWTDGPALRAPRVLPVRATRP